MDRLIGQLNFKEYHFRIVLAIVVHSSLGYANKLLQFSFNVLQPQMLTFLNTSMRRQYGADLNEGNLTWVWGFTASCDTVGGIVGALLMAPLLERYGRRFTVMVASNGLSLVACLLQVAALPVNRFEFIIVGRFLGGVAIALNQAIIIFMAECTANEIRGAASTVLQAGKSLWLIVATVVAMPAFLGTKNAWPFYFAVPILPIIGHMVFSTVFPKSPKYLYIMEQKETETVNAIKYYHGDAADIEQTLEEYDGEISTSIATDGKTASWRTILTSSTLKKPLIICVVAQIASTFNGNALVIASFGVPQSLTLALMLGGELAMLVACVFVSVLLMESVGRRPLLLVATATAILGLVLVMAGAALADRQANAFVTSVVGMLGTLGFGASDMIGLITIPGLLVGEVCPQASRAKVNGLINFIWQFGSLIQVLLFPHIRYLIGAWCYVPFITIELACLLWFWRHMPETKQKPVSDIVHQFDDADAAVLLSDYYTPLERSSLRRRSRRGRRGPSAVGDSSNPPSSSPRGGYGSTDDSPSAPTTVTPFQLSSFTPPFVYTDNELEDEKNYDRFLRN